MKSVPVFKSIPSYFHSFQFSNIMVLTRGTISHPFKLKYFPGRLMMS